MRVINRPPRQGKTQQLVSMLCAEELDYLVVMSQQEQERIVHEYNLPAKYWSRVVVASNQRLRGFPPLARVAVDNLEACLYHYLGHTVDIVTITG